MKDNNIDIYNALSKALSFMGCSTQKAINAIKDLEYALNQLTIGSGDEIEATPQEETSQFDNAQENELKKEFTEFKEPFNETQLGSIVKSEIPNQESDLEIFDTISTINFNPIFIDDDFWNL